MNGYLPTLPEDLRRCRKMTHLSLVYTHTAMLPAWVKEFTQLQYLHIEGTATASLESLPQSMFDKMDAFAFLHLGIHPMIPVLPSFKGLTSLKSLTLALLFSLEELPSFENLHNVERIVLTSLVTIVSLPDLTHLTRLTNFAVADRGSWCCNGFLGDCDLSSPHCRLHPLWGTPAASCLAVNRTDDRPTRGTLEVLKKYSNGICGALILPGTAEGPPTEVGMDQCNGTLYRQCQVPGHPEAMCYNARFMGISCSENPHPIEMRRRQILRGVGEPCHPIREAWLGCNSP
ncbi:hypothetical protein PHYPSEUDO_006445 [Phytophthora pseudosyringae]|uniref:WLGC domain-containing protein n=1 Tax=Phytophthora pseudosyringae TaxID=221518 RepID=A0A8T1VLR5_9STRA|nr:hypothetical protein PHYPSEUDO_006445 [Phytophthora pseudosyringae]